MSFVLSQNRHCNDPEESRRSWDRYRQHLDALKHNFPKSAFKIATSDWWYAFDDSKAPHDSRLLEIRMGDHGAPDWDNKKYSWIEVRLHSAFSGIICLRYPKVFSYRFSASSVSQGIHGDWRYDEFTLNEDGHLVHTIEWADGADWIIEADDLLHSYVNE